jgi:plasmid stabilization system protein ParE
VRIHWSPLALAKVNEIIDYIARDRPMAAERWAVGVFDLVERLARSPKRGRVVPEAGREEIRELLYGQYRIIYRVEEGSVSILTVRHGRRLLDLEEIEG